MDERQHELLSASLDGALSETERREVADLLANNDEARHVLAGLAKASQAARTLPQIAAPSRVHSGVMEAVAASRAATAPAAAPETAPVTETPAPQPALRLVHGAPDGGTEVIQRVRLRNRPWFPGAVAAAIMAVVGIVTFAVQSNDMDSNQRVAVETPGDAINGLGQPTGNPRTGRGVDRNTEIAELHAPTNRMSDAARPASAPGSSGMVESPAAPTAPDPTAGDAPELVTGNQPTIFGPPPPNADKTAAENADVAAAPAKPNEAANSVYTLADLPDDALAGLNNVVLTAPGEQLSASALVTKTWAAVVSAAPAASLSLRFSEATVSSAATRQASGLPNIVESEGTAGSSDPKAEAKAQPRNAIREAAAAQADRVVAYTTVEAIDVLLPRSQVTAFLRALHDLGGESGVRFEPDEVLSEAMQDPDMRVLRQNTLRRRAMRSAAEVDAGAPKPDGNATPRAADSYTNAVGTRDANDDAPRAEKKTADPAVRVRIAIRSQ